VNWVDVMLQYTLNEFIKGKEVDIFLLDERYNRDTLPCHVRKSFCRDVVLPNLDHQEYAWYVDGFLLTTIFYRCSIYLVLSWSSNGISLLLKGVFMFKTNGPIQNRKISASDIFVNSCNATLSFLSIWPCKVKWSLVYDCHARPGV
jgi:hypothetical protein